jgi:Cysteinyl-tRNA synthetase
VGLSWHGFGDDGIIGIEPETAAAGEAMPALSALVEQQIALRAEARDNKDFEMADQIRNRLAEIGVILSDDADGTSWSLDG